MICVGMQQEPHSIAWEDKHSTLAWQKLKSVMTVAVSNTLSYLVDKLCPTLGFEDRPLCRFDMDYRR